MVYGLKEHFSAFESISQKIVEVLCFQTALMDTPLLGEEMGLQASEMGLHCLWLQASLFICCWAFLVWFMALDCENW